MYPFPSGQAGKAPPPGQFGHPQAPYGPPPAQQGPPGFVPYMQAQPPYGQAPQPGYGGQPPHPPGGIQPGGYMKLPDGTYAPVMAQYIDGKVQYVTTGSPPGGRPLQPQPSGYVPGQGYNDGYRPAHEPDSKVNEWNWRMEKERGKADKEAAKKLREWEKDQRAREEAEARQLKAVQAKDRKNERQRRMSVSSATGGQPMFDRERKLSTGGASEMDRRFAGLSVNMDGRYPGHTRKLSTSEGDYTHARSASGGFYPTSAGPYGRSRPPSPNFHQPSPNSGIGIPIPGAANGKSPYGGPPGSLPGNAAGQLGMPHGPVGYGTSPTGPYPSISPHPKPPGPFASPRGVTAPPSFFREPSRAQPYTRFDNFAIVWDIKEMLMGSPPLPALLLPCDVLHADWDRCMADLIAAWSGKPTYDLAPRPRRSRVRRPGAAVCDVVDIWNINFFAGRDIELVLYRALERRSGPIAGRRDQRLRRAMVPPQYSTVARKRERIARKGDDSSSDSLSSSGDDDDDDEDEEDDEDDSGSDESDPPYARPRSGYPASVGGQQPRSRAASMSRGAGPGMDPNERWIMMSREAKRAYRNAREREKRIRREERRKKKALRGEGALYSLHVFYHPRP